MKIQKCLQHPAAVFAGMGIGVIVGMFFPSFARAFSEIGSVYLLLVQMTVVPILVSAVVSSISRFLQNQKLQNATFYIIFIMVLIMLITIVFAIAAGLLFKPGEIPLEKTKILSDYIGSQSDTTHVSLKKIPQENNKSSSSFFQILVPANIFESLAKGDVLSITFMSIILGISAGLLHSKRRERNPNAESLIIVFFENLFTMFQTILFGVLTLLPIGLIFIIGTQIANFGFEIINATLRLIIVFYVFSIVMILINTISMVIFTKSSFGSAIKAGLYPGVIGFTTKSSIAAILPAIDSISRHLGIDYMFAKLVIPLSMILARYGNIAYFGLVAIFASQLYNVSLAGFEYFVLIVGILLAGLSTTGSTGFATLSVISIAFAPVGLPIETILFILYAIDPIIDPIRTTLIVHTNIALVSITGAKFSSKQNKNAKLDVN